MEGRCDMLPTPWVLSPLSLHHSFDFSIALKGWPELSARDNLQKVELSTHTNFVRFTHTLSPRDDGVLFTGSSSKGHQVRLLDIAPHRHYTAHTVYTRFSNLRRSHLI